MYIAKALREDAYACKVPVSTAVLKHLIGFKPVAEGSSEYQVHWAKAEYDDDFLFALTRSLSKWHLLQSELCAAVMHRYPPAKVGLIDVDTYKPEQGTVAAVNMLPCPMQAIGTHCRLSVCLSSIETPTDIALLHVQILHQCTLTLQQYCTDSINASAASTMQTESLHVCVLTFLIPYCGLADLVMISPCSMQMTHCLVSWPLRIVV